MKNFRLFLAGALALVALSACNDEKEETIPGVDERQNEETCAAQASVTSSDANFTATDNGGTISFKTEGGTVTLTVTCGCNWIVQNSAEDLFPSSTTSNSLTITAGQNTVENELTGTITLMTETYRISFSTISITQSAYGAPEITVELTEWAVPAKGALTTEIAVTASADWIAESADAWLTVEKGGSGITLTASENGETTERETKVTLTCTDGIRTAYDYVTVTQDALAYITLDSDEVYFGMDGGEASVAVESNYDWDYSYYSTNGWLTISRNGDALTITATANEGDTREEVVTVTAGDGAENVVEVQLKVSQDEYMSTEDAMILTYTTTSANTTVQLPLDGTVNCTIDWGDGSKSETVTSTLPSHEYSKAGEYDVTINGTVTALENFKASSASRTLITGVKQWGNTGLTSLNQGLYGASKITSIPAPGDSFAKVTNFFCFLDGTSLKEIPEGMFDNCPNATIFGYCFYETEITVIPTGLFDNCEKATDFTDTFRNCKNLTSIPAGLFDKCPNVTSFESTFYACSALESIPDGLFADHSKVTTFFAVFYSCPLITKIPANLFDGCTSVDTFQQAFSSCTGLTEVPAGLFDSCTKVSNFRNLFSGVTSTFSIPEGLFSKNIRVTNFLNTFRNATGLTGESPYDVIEVDGKQVKVHLYERENYPDIYAKPIEFENCFTNCTNASDYYDIPSSWK